MHSTPFSFLNSFSRFIQLRCFLSFSSQDMRPSVSFTFSTCCLENLITKPSLLPSMESLNFPYFPSSFWTSLASKKVLFPFGGDSSFSFLYPSASQPVSQSFPFLLQLPSSFLHNPSFRSFPNFSSLLWLFLFGLIFIHSRETAFNYLTGFISTLLWSTVTMESAEWLILFFVALVSFRTPLGFGLASLNTPSPFELGTVLLVYIWFSRRDSGQIKSSYWEESWERNKMPV